MLGQPKAAESGRRGHGEATTAAPAMDPVAAKRERKTIAQRLRRAAAKASVQWRGDAERTAAAQ